MKAYISISYNKKEDFSEEIKIIKDALNEYHIIPFVFAEKYLFATTQEKEMMQQALADIDDSDFLIAEVSDKAIGIGVEAGYAKAMNKTVIYIRNKNAEHSTTISGVSDYSIFYNDIYDLKTSLLKIIKQIAQ